MESECQLEAFFRVHVKEVIEWTRVAAVETEVHTFKVYCQGRFDLLALVKIRVRPASNLEESSYIHKSYTYLPTSIIDGLWSQ